MPSLILLQSANVAEWEAAERNARIPAEKRECFHAEAAEKQQVPKVGREHQLRDTSLDCLQRSFYSRMQLLPPDCPLPAFSPLQHHGPCSFLSLASEGMCVTACTSRDGQRGSRTTRRTGPWPKHRLSVDVATCCYG